MLYTMVFGLIFIIILYTIIWFNFHTNTEHYAFCPNSHTNAIHYAFWPKFHPNAINYAFWPNLAKNIVYSIRIKISPKSIVKNIYR